MIEGYLLNGYNIEALNIANLISKFGICMYSPSNKWAAIKQNYNDNKNINGIPNLFDYIVCVYSIYLYLDMVIQINQYIDFGLIIIIYISQ